jgi:hypothetical protein
MIHRVDNCFGLTLWAWRKRIELWLCLGGVPEHAHPGQHVEIVPLFGWAEFMRIKPCDGATVAPTIETVKVQPKCWLRSFSIPAGWVHAFKLNRRPLVFLNITTGRSAAENLVE